MSAARDKSWILLAQHETPLETVLARANKDSMNLYAECLCKRLGAETSGQSGSWENGVAAVEAFLQKAGASPDQFHLVDGCGLSKENRISAAAMVDVLSYDYFSNNAAAFHASLAVAGVDGTLKDRFRGSDLRTRSRWQKWIRQRRQLAERISVRQGRPHIRLFDFNQRNSGIQQFRSQSAGRADHQSGGQRRRRHGQRGALSGFQREAVAATSGDFSFSRAISGRSVVPCTRIENPTTP